MLAVVAALERLVARIAELTSEIRAALADHLDAHLRVQGHPSKRFVSLLFQRCVLTPAT